MNNDILNYKQLQDLNNDPFSSGLTPEEEAEIRKELSRGITPYTSAYDPSWYEEDKLDSGVKGGWGSSVFDPENVTEDELAHLSDIRASNQPGYLQLGAGILKGTLLAGTTIIDNIVGLGAGVINGISNIADEDEKTSFMQGFIENPVSRALTDFNNMVNEDALPNYYTEEELNNKWYQNLGTANFWGDKVIKNLGFTAGAMYGGIPYAKMAGGIAKALKASGKATSMAASVTGSTLSSINEARSQALGAMDAFGQEALQGIKQRTQEEISKLDQEFNFRNTSSEEIGGFYFPMSEEEYQERYSKIMEARDLATAEINENREKIGNSSFAVGLALLLPSNFMQLKGIYSRGYKPTIRHSNTIKKKGSSLKEGVESTLEESAPSTLGILAKNIASEGIWEEGMLTAADAGFSNMYNSRIANLQNSQLNTESANQVSDDTNTFIEGIVSSLDDGSFSESSFIGGLTGGVMSMRVRNPKNDKGESQSMLYLDDREEWRQAKKLDNEIVSLINANLEDSKLKALSKGLVGHYTYQNIMNGAALQKNEKDYKTAEQAQLINMIDMFDRAGMIEDLKSYVNDAFDTSEDNLSEIIKSTTEVKEGKIIGGAFSEFATYDKDNKAVIPNLSEENKAKMSEILNKDAKKFKDQIDKYQTINTDIQTLYGDLFNEEQIQEIVYKQSMSEDWKNRRDIILEETKPLIQNAISNLSNTLDKLSNENEKLDKYNSLLSLNSEELLSALTKKENAEAVDIFKTLLFNSNPIKGEDFKQKFKDAIELNNSAVEYTHKIKEYLENPSKLQEEIQETKDNISKEIEEKENQEVEQKLNESSSRQEVESIVIESNNSKKTDKIVQKQAEKGNTTARNYLKAESVKKVIEEETAKLGPLRKIAVTNILNSHLSQIEDVSDIAAVKEQIEKDPTISNEEHRKAALAIIDKLQGDKVLFNALSTEEKSTEGVLEKKDNNTEESITKEEEILENQFQNNVIDTEQSDTEEDIYNINNVDFVFDGKTKDFQRPVIPKYAIEFSRLGFPNNFLETTSTPELNAVHFLLYKFREIDESLPDNNSLNIINKILKHKKELQNNLTLDYIKEILETEGIDKNEYVIQAYNDALKKREQKEDYSVLYKYLEDKGAFDVVDKGELSVGEEISYVIDPKLNADIEESIGIPITVILLQKQNGQIVGSLDSIQHSSNFIGLSTLIKAIEEDYGLKGIPEGESLYKYSRSTHVAKLMYNTPIKNTFESISKLIEDKADNSKYPYIAIGKNGSLSANNTSIDENINYNNIKIKEGRIYVLTPLENGQYAPKAVKVKPFQSFDIQDVNFTSTNFYKQLYAEIKKFRGITSNDIHEISKIKQGLKKYLYVENLGIFLNFDTNGNPVSISLSKVSRDKNKNIERDEKGKIKIEGEKQKVLLNDDTELGVLKVLQELGFNFQIDINQIQNTKYREDIINADLLTSNISSLNNKGSWFLLNYYDENGEYQNVSTFEDAPDNVFDPKSINSEEEKSTPEEIYTTVNQALNGNPLTNNEEIPSIGDDTEGENDDLSSPRGLIIDPNDEDDYDIFTSKVKESSAERIDTEKEIEWLERVLPQYTKQDRLQIIEDYIKIVESNELAEGSYHKDIITLSKLATPGTMYHEAFHGVFGSILSEKEQQKILEEASKQFGDKTDLLLEEDLAEAFREYVLTGVEPTLGQRILNFFKRLFNITSSQDQMNPYLSNLFYKINQGKYAKNNARIRTKTVYSKVKKPFSAELLLDKKYTAAKKIVSELNKRRYNTESEAFSALQSAGINTIFYHPRVSIFKGKYKQGYKIQIMNKEMFTSMREDILDQEEIMQELNKENNERNFDSYSPEKQMTAMNKGWTKEKFDGIKSQELKEAIMECF